MTMVNAFDTANAPELSAEDAALIARRNRALGPAYRLFYREPLHAVEGRGVWLYDRKGDAYLDAYNNVASVGHCHPHVVEAISRQAAKLNTHTRYLHDTVVDYAERLLAKLPSSLGHMMFTCTGSEANDLALRIARAATGRQGVIVTRLAYHGLTEAVAEASPSLGGHIVPSPRVRFVDAPDSLRVPAGQQGERLRAGVAEAIASMRADGVEPAALLMDSIFASDGIYPDPAAFLGPAVEEIHKAGGVFIADEVQPGFARTGETFWGFQRHGVVPDFVTMGKPMGNGFPVAGVAMRPDLVADFGARARYFNTFGGNPVAMAAGMAVLDVIEQESLAANAVTMGAYLRDGIEEACKGRPDIAQVRGAGLFIGVECVLSASQNTPDAALASAIVNGLRQNRVLISACGKGANILKIRPPLVIQREEADIFLRALRAVFDTL
ncbi:aspartate aminotransferase family protein [Devosia sp. A369]